MSDDELRIRLWRAEIALLNATMGVMEPVAQYMRDYPEPVKEPAPQSETRVDQLEREVMSAHALLHQYDGGCACEVCRKFMDAREVAYVVATRAGSQL